MSPDDGDMTTSKRILGWLLALWVPFCLAVRSDVQTQHSLEEAVHHGQASTGPVSTETSQAKLESSAVTQGVHVCHTCLLCAQRPTAADQPISQCWTVLDDASCLGPCPQSSSPCTRIDSPYRRGPPTSLLS